MKLKATQAKQKPDGKKDGENPGRVVLQQSSVKELRSGTVDLDAASVSMSPIVTLVATSNWRRSLLVVWAL